MIFRRIVSPKGWYLYSSRHGVTLRCISALIKITLRSFTITRNIAVYHADKGTGRRVCVDKNTLI